jgi:hypothetical protein
VVMGESRPVRVWLVDDLSEWLHANARRPL